MRSHLATMLFVAALAPVTVADTPAEFVVSYVSVDHVYVQAGRADGLAVGDRLEKRRNSETVAALGVDFVAQHSASCRFLEANGNVKTGDVLIRTFHTPALPPDSQAIATPIETTATDALDPPVSERSLPRAPTALFGTIALTVYHWNDHATTGMDFTQTSARISLRAENFGREDVTLAVRTRGRYDIRSRAYATGGPETEWKNRLWVLSLTYQSPGSPLSLSVGRFLPHGLGNLGYIDGGMLAVRLSEPLKAGVLVGRRPEWAYNEPRLSLMKYGGFLAFRSGLYGPLYIDQVVGAAAEVHAGTTSRSFMVWNGSIRHRGVVGFNQSIEMDLNRGWRRERAGKSLTLSNLYLQAWTRPSRALRLSLQYDNRQNYWTVEYASVADSLFDDRVRQGLRGRIDLKPLDRTSLSASLGYRKATGDADPTINYSTSLHRSGLLGVGSSIRLSLAGFNGIYEHGTNYGVRVYLPSWRAVRAFVAVGGYAYSVDDQGDSRRSTSYELGSNLDLPGGLYLGGSTEASVGDDIDGLRMLFELGYRY